MRFSKTFFTFNFLSEYSFKIANLSWRKLIVIFCCQSHEVIFAPKVEKHTIVGNTKFDYRAKYQLKRLKISLKEISFNLMTADPASMNNNIISYQYNLQTIKLTINQI